MSRYSAFTPRLLFLGSACAPVCLVHSSSPLAMFSRALAHYSPGPSQRLLLEIMSDMGLSVGLVCTYLGSPCHTYTMYAENPVSAGSDRLLGLCMFGAGTRLPAADLWYTMLPAKGRVCK